MLQKLKIELIVEWRQAWKYMSVQLATIGLMIQWYLLEFPVDAYAHWAALPAEVKAVIPETVLPYVGPTIIALSLVSRLIKQSNVRKEQHDKPQ